MKSILIGMALGLILSVLYVSIDALIRVNKSYSLYKILDEKGYCVEFLHAYEQKRIIGKPFKLDYALEYAEIIMRIGKPDEAIKYLNTLTIPPNANILRSRYFFLYVLSALKIGNLAIADDMWNRSGDLISKISANYRLCVSGGYLAIIAMILTDCFAAQQNGDRARLERAFQQTEDILINTQITDKTLLQIMRLYELRELGLTEHYNSLLPKVREEIYASEPLFRCIKDMQLENLSRVENGMLPFQSLDKREKCAVIP
ncbi:MAG: hypothetical protein K2N06_04175 [Oscillospiraceae bacterium]|nr:hypothetical protein [Oscillospiraceae bacterium]